MAPRAARIAAMALWLAVPAAAQDAVPDSMTMPENPSAPVTTDRANPAPVVVQYYRPNDARGINMFEAPKVAGVPYTGFSLQWGAAFTQQFQALRHSNNPTPLTDPVRLITIGSGFNNADANLYMNAQLARGVRVQLTSYLSSRHHNETWVKDGYLLIDDSPWENPLLDNIMKVVTLRIGHFEINYGDQHFRRSDNGQAMFNPLVGNLLMDAFTTEIGGEIYARKNGFLAMGAVTGGEVRGQVTKPENRSPSYIGKVGFDRQINHALRARLTGSIYQTTESQNNTLYTGSRAGSRYFYVIENINATETAQAWSGDVRPGFSNKVTAWVVNPFVVYRGLEVFGTYEEAKGRALTETTKRKFTQWAGEGVYRFLKNQLYVAGRYNEAKGTYPGMTSDATVTRLEVGGGWFLTKNLEAKGEYVNQEHKDFPVSDIRHDAKFHGAMFEAVVSF
jgi:hypothetical protein